MLFLHLRLGLPTRLLSSVFRTKTLHTFLFSQYVAHAPLISSSSICSPQYSVRNTKENHRKPHTEWSVCRPVVEPGTYWT